MVPDPGIPFWQSYSGSFGASSSLAVGTTPSAFGGTQPPDATFDQKPDSGAFWSNSGQTSHFGSMTQPSLPAFGSNMFGTSTPFGGNQSAFGTTSTPVFGSGAIGTPPVGAAGSQVFGDTSTPVSGSSSVAYATPTASVPGFGSSSSPSFSFPSAHAFRQSTAAFGTIPFGGQATTTTSGTGFWNSAFGVQRGGSRVATYTGTVAADSFGNGKMVELMSISAMSDYVSKSHEELRFEDYQLGDKGGLNAGGGSGFGTSTTQSGPLNHASVFAQTTSPSIFSPRTPFTSAGFGISSSPFSSSSPPFWPSSTANPVTPPSSSPSSFGQACPPSFISTPATSTFRFPAPSSNSTFNYAPTSSIAQTGGALGQTSTSFWPTQTPFGQTNMYQTPSTGIFTTTSSFAPSSPSSSVFGQMATHSTYNSGLHSFTPSIPQTGGTFGQTSTHFGQNMFNTPFNGISGGYSAASPTSNAVCFSHPAFLYKDLERDTDMDDHVFC